MAEIKRVLLPTDFSECAMAAADYACNMVDKFGAELVVLHVVHDVANDIPDFGMGLAFPAYLENTAEHRKEVIDYAQKSVDELIKSFPEVPTSVTSNVKLGTAHREIIDFAAENDIDLIVIGTHGRTGFSHAILGSVAERVIRHATCPVLTIRHNESA